jgi:hypothetical protein
LSNGTAVEALMRALANVAGEWDDEATESKIMAANSILLLAVDGSDFLAGVQIYEIGLGWTARLLIDVAAQRGGCHRRALTGNPWSLWIRDTDKCH